MSGRRADRLRARADYWPGFVDATATLLLVVVFLLSVFVLGEFALSRERSGEDRVLKNLRSQISDLASLLALERREKASLELTIGSLSQTLSEARGEERRLRVLLEGEGDAEADEARLQEALEDERRANAEALEQAAFLNQQIAALRGQLRSLQEALEASEARDRESRAQIADLGRRLNTALAQKVQELARHKSAFFAALGDILGAREDFEIVGDRFILPSEVLFESGSAEINARGRWELRKVAEVLKEVSKEIPKGVKWILRVDGHTDAAPIRKGSPLDRTHRSNWGLSSARALAVVEYLVEEGIAPAHLAATGFGEFHPLEEGISPEAYRRNRRIELKLTER